MAQPAPIKLGVLGSGKGSNFAAIAECCASGTLSAEVRLVLSDVPGAGILDHAKRFGIPGAYVNPGAYRTKLDDAAEREYVRLLQEAQVDYVVLAGFMRIIKADFLKHFWQRVINIHPSLLPSFPGLEAWKQALDYGVKFTGCTVHLVDHGIDTGPILGQRTVPVLDGDTAQSLHARIQEAERTLYPETLQALALGQVQIQGRKSLRTTGVAPHA